jgi:hypothetical protein
MMKKTTLLITLVLLILVPSLSAEAKEESKANGFSIIPFVGYHFGYEFGSLVPLPNTADVPEITVQSKSKGVRVGFSLGYQLTKNIEIQGTFIYGASEFQDDVGIGIAGVPMGIVKVSDANTFSYSGNILYSIPLHCFSLYVAGGIGAVTMKPDLLETKTRMQLNFGAGIKMNLANHLRLFLDVRDYVSFFDFAQDFDVFYTAIYDQVFKKSQHQIGINFGFGYGF